MSSSTPDFLGPYRVVRLIGRGGMGAVYEAVHETNQERVAVKIVSEELAHEQRFQRRFEAEIQTLIRLKHPNIVRLIGTGVHKSLPFYSMEFIEGVNLHQKLKEHRRLGWTTVLDWAIDIASALKQAHDFGVVHRDLKPANLMVTPEGKIKIVDFGISRLFGNNSATLPGSTVGTADFMPPEQAEGTVATSRSDLYALGAICYTCLSGRPPFTGKSVPEILFNVRYGVYLPLNQLVPEVPKEFCALIDEMLSRDPSKRPATAYLAMNRLQAMRAGLKRRDASKSDSKAGEATSQPENDQVLEAQTSIDLSSLPSVADLSNSPYHDATRIDPPKDIQGADPSKDNTTPEGPGRTNRPIAAVRSLAEEATREQFSDASLADPLTSPGMLTDRGSTFSEVSDVDRARSSIFESSDPYEKKREWWTEIAMLLGALVFCAGAFYYFSRPVDPNSLYEPIHSALLQGDESRLLELEDQIRAFQQKYPNDPRIDQIDAAAQEVEYIKRLRHLQRSTLGRYQGQEAMIAALREIVRSKELFPQRSRSQLSAFLAAYPDDLLTDQEQDWVRFARRLAQEMDAKRDPDSERVKTSQLESLFNRIMSTELGVDHRRALTGLIELYESEPWAMPIVAKARGELKNLMPEPPAP